MMNDVVDAVVYDCSTGLFVWKYRPDMSNSWNARFAGKQALNIDSDGYKSGRINYRIYQAHRVAWLIHYGEWPDGQVDHINMVRSDNRIDNLRLATRSENAMNRGKQNDNTSGYKGVSWHKSSGKWQAKIKKNGKCIYLGTYHDVLEAHLAYCRAVHDVHGQFARISQ